MEPTAYAAKNRTLGVRAWGLGAGRGLGGTPVRIEHGRAAHGHVDYGLKLNPLLRYVRSLVWDSRVACVTCHTDWAMGESRGPHVLERNNKPHTDLSFCVLAAGLQSVLAKEAPHAAPCG
eukprot:3229772-Prymnesium_polylepis.2